MLVAAIVILVSSSNAATTQVIFNLNSASPAGSAVPSTDTLLAIFNVTAIDGDVTFDGPTAPGVNAGNSITINLNGNCDGWPVKNTSLRLKDEFGTLLDEISGVNLCNFMSYTFDFIQSDFIVPASQTKQLYVNADTTSLGSDFVLQVSLIDDDPTNIDWSIAYNGQNIQNASMVFAGDIYANPLLFDGTPSLVKPVFSLNPTSPAGLVAPSTNSLLAKFDVYAQNGSITFDGPAGPGPNAGNTLTVFIQTNCTCEIGNPGGQFSFKR